MTNQEQNREALIRHIADLEAVTRRRNEQINNQAKTIEAMRAEMLACDVHNGSVIPDPRHLTPDAITDEMVERALNTYRDVRSQQGYILTSNDKTQEAMSHALRAALTEPPARPGGAEELGELIGTWTATEDIAPADLPTGSLATLADFLAERGVRIVGEERS